MTTDVNHDQWTDDLLEEFARGGDAPADTLVGLGAGRVDLVRFLSGTGRNDQWTPHFASLPSEPPHWVDQELMRGAEELFYRHGTRIVLGLFCAVLPRGYALGQKYSASSLSTANPARYTPATAQFLLDILSPEALSPRGRGVHALRRLRLLRALARLHGDEAGAPGEIGSQAHLAAVIAAYSTILIECLERLAIEVSPEEKHGFLHFWNVVGHMLGLDPTFRFVSLESASAYLSAYERRRVFIAPALGPLIEFMNSLLPPALLKLPEAFVILFLGVDHANTLGIHAGKDSVQAPLMDSGAWLERMGARPEQNPRLSGRVARALLDGMTHLRDVPREFDLPPVLRTGWKVNATRRLKKRLRRFSSVPRLDHETKDRDFVSSSGPGRETSALFPNRH